MPSLPFKPAKIYVDTAVSGLPLTQNILQKFPDIEKEEINDIKLIKKPAEMTGAKKSLLLARLKADPLKEFQAMTESSQRPYFALNLISNCHLECTYCILQSYLANNPIITIFTNLDEILMRLADQLKRIPPGSIIGTGKIADSLALENISEHHQHLIPFFARQDRITLELKTKSAQVESLLNLDHQNKTILSWSINAPQIIEQEEYKTASFEERLKAAYRVSEKNYPIAFHFDPMICHEGWQKNYSLALRKIFNKISPEKIAWISVGTLRFPFKQQRIMRERFPKNESIHEGLLSTSRVFLHYPDDQREQMHQFMEKEISQYYPLEKYYRCMDFE